MLSYDQWDILVRATALAATAAGLALPGGWRQRVAPITRRPRRAAGIVALVSLMVNVTVALQHGIPKPRVHDEYAYLLAADTFAHGRLTNPTPACADSFQSPHVLVRPTYMAKYPPAQGIALAAGQVLGKPIFGVWISGALAAVAAWWMVGAFAGAEWALLGGVVAAVHPQLVDWGQVYWGGDVAVIGGALIVGACGRLVRDEAPGVHPGLLLGLGLVVLANSRPFEGLVLAIPLVATFIAAAGFSPRAFHGLKPAAAILLLGALATALYNHAVTGHVLRLPFAEYAAQFDVYPKFWFLPKHAPPTYPNETMAAVHTVKERGRFDLLQTWPGRCATAIEWARRLLLMHARPIILIVPLAASLRVRRARWIWATIAIFLLGLMTENWFLPHYAAPVTPAIVLLCVLGWERLAAWDGPMPSFVRRLGRGVAVGFLAAAAVSAFAPSDPDLKRFTRDDLIAEQPALTHGRHVIFVRYAADHPVEDEWVYNGADVAGQSIVWARALGTTQDDAVIAAYGPRRAWVLTVERDAHDLVEHSTFSDGPEGRHQPVDGPPGRR